MSSTFPLMATRESSSTSNGGELGGFQSGLHAALAVFITILGTSLAMKYQPVSVSPFEANPITMMFFLGSLSLYIVGMMTADMMRGTNRGLLLWHISLTSGFFASASLLYLLVPASFWWFSIASLYLLLLIAPPCKPIQLFYSKIQQHYYLFRRSQELDSRSTDVDDLENNLQPLPLNQGSYEENLQTLPDSRRGSNEEADHPPDASVQGANSCIDT